MTIIEHLPADFFETSWRKRPLVLRGAGRQLIDRVSSEEVESFVIDNAEGPRGWRPRLVSELGPISFIANAEVMNAPLAHLCDEVRSEFRWPHCDLVLIRNRAASASGPHFDNDDTFAVQMEGRKRWQLWPSSELTDAERRARILQLPLVGELPVPIDPADVVDVVLEAGDIMYVPLCWGHHARALMAGLTLSISVKAVLPGQAAVELMRQRLVDSPDPVLALPLPAEVDDWSASCDPIVRDAATRLLGGIAGREPAERDAAELLSPAIAAFASSAHRVHTATLPADDQHHDGQMNFAEAIRPLAAELDRVAGGRPPRLTDLLLTGSAADVEQLVRWVGAVNARRVLRLAAMGPERSWPEEPAAAWSAAQGKLSDCDVDTLCRAAATRQLLGQTTELLREARSFNRARAARAFTTWVQPLDIIDDHRGGPLVLEDLSFGLATSDERRSSVRSAIAAVDAVLPGFEERLGVGCESVWLQPTEALRAATSTGAPPRVIRLDSEAEPDELAIGLVAGWAALVVDLHARAGFTAPRRGTGAEAVFGTVSDRLARAAAAALVAHYLERTGDGGEVAWRAHARGLATAEVAAGPGGAIGAGVVEELTVLAGCETVGNVVLT